MIEYTAIIPIFNRAPLLVRAVRSVLAQSLPASEIIVVDDASTDDLAAALAEVSGRSLQVIRHQQNRGAGAARNTGASTARTPWIAFLDSDDEWAPSKAERQFGLLLRQTEAPVRAGVTGYAIRDSRNVRVDTFQPRAGTIGPQELALGCPFSIGSTLAVEREAFLSVGGFDPSLRRLEDWDWVMRYQRRHALSALPDVLTTVHKSSDPSYEQVARAVRRLRELHGAAWRERSFAQGRKFESTLAVEEAAGAYFDGRRGRAVALTLRAIAAYPLRGMPFYAMLAHRLARTLVR